jgi:hypothetical protein
LADLTGSDDDDYIAHSYSLLRKIAPQLVRLVCRWDDGDKRSIHRTGKHTKLWHTRESSNRGRSMGSYSPYCVEGEFCELRRHGVLGRSSLGVPHSITPAAANAMPKLCPNHPGKILPERYNSQP